MCDSVQNSAIRYIVLVGRTRTSPPNLAVLGDTTAEHVRA